MNQVSNKIKYLLATKQVDFANDAFQCALMASGFAFDKDAHHRWADISAQELAAGFGYLAGGKAMAGVTVTEDDVNDRCEVAWNNVTWLAAGGNIGPSPGAIVYDDTLADKNIVGFIDFFGEYTQVDGGSATIADVKFRIG